MANESEVSEGFNYRKLWKKRNQFLSTGFIGINRDTFIPVGVLFI